MLSSSATEYFQDGDYDDAALWYRALEPEEMRALHEEGVRAARRPPLRSVRLDFVFEGDVLHIPPGIEADAPSLSGTLRDGTISIVAKANSASDVLPGFAGIGDLSFVIDLEDQVAVDAVTSGSTHVTPSFTNASDLNPDKESFSFPSVTFSMAGDYVCTGAGCSAADHESSFARVFVRGAPMVILIAQIDVPRGASASLSMDVQTGQGPEDFIEFTDLSGFERGRRFTDEAKNLVADPEFESDLGSWDPDPFGNAPGTYTFSSEDHASSSTSGSIELVNTNPEASKPVRVRSSCFEVAGLDMLRASAHFYVPAQQETISFASCGFSWYSTPDCEASSSLGTTGHGGLTWVENHWTKNEFELLSPGLAQGARYDCTVFKEEAGGSILARLDGLTVAPEPSAAWLAGAALLTMGALRARRRHAR